MHPGDDASAPDPAGLPPAEIPGSTRGERPGRGPRRRRRLGGAALALLAGAIAAGACEGDNIWSGNAESLQPTVIGVSVPAPVSPGDIIQVQVSAYGQRQIAAIAVQLAGAVSRDTTVTVETPAPSVVTTLTVALPAVFADTVLIVRAIAYDKAGAASRIRSDTSSVVAPPDIVDFAGPDSVRPGQALDLAIHAVGVRPVAKVRVRLRAALSLQDSILVSQPRRDVQETIRFHPPATPFGDTVVIVDMQAVDNTGMAGLIFRGTLPVAIAAPAVDSLWVPESIRPGVILDGRVFAHGARPLTQIAISLRGAYNTDVTLPITPARAGVIKDFSVSLGAVPADPVLLLKVRATDSAGSVSNILQRTIDVSATAPVTSAGRR